MKHIQSAFLPGKLHPDYADAADFLRVASVGMIGWYHIWQQSWLNPDLHIFGRSLRFYPVVACGYMFVDLMLLISGFLLMLGHLSGRSRNVRNFYAARAARILPSYLLCMVVMLFVFALPQGLYTSFSHLLKDLIPHLTFTHNLFRQSHSFTHLNGALWTLAVEVQFYLIFPLLARAFERRPAGTYGAMIVLSTAAKLAVTFLADEPSFYINRLSVMLDVYANGMLAAWIYIRLTRRPQRAWDAWLCTALTLASAVLIYYVFKRQLDLRGSEVVSYGQLYHRIPLSLLGSVFLVCGSRSVMLLRGLFSNRIVRFLSGLSFNFYIWHQFIAVRLKEWRIPYYEGANPNQAGLQPWQQQYTLICFACALLTALIITYAVEKPCGRWLKKHLSRKCT